MRIALVRASIAVAVAALTSTMLSGVVPSAAGAATSGLTASAPGITKSTIKIGILSDLTGAAASSFDDSPEAIEARFKQINAAGGIDGRKIIWTVADTTSSPAGAETAAKELVQTQGVFLVAPVSALTFGGAQYLNQAGVPVIGSPVDGPEWDEQPNTNMFSYGGSASPNNPSYTDYGKFYKALGAKKVSLIASNTPSSTEAIAADAKSIEQAGLATCDDTVVPIGGVNFTTYALSFKSAGCDTAECSCVLSSSLAVSTALRQDGLTKVKVIFDAGPTTQVYGNSEDLAAANGAYFEGTTYGNAAGKAFLSGLKKYDPQFKGGLPDLGQSEGWPTANLVIEGLQVAGMNPTRQSLIANLRKVTNWTDEGLSPSPISFAHFGQAPPTTCLQYVQFVNKKYVPFPKNGKAFCGTLIPGTASSPS
ncbi:MAG TPA: ABC transporter substrate-binding protein [Acidimicrobiales bacterium]|jgi:branched-chain amino acid transport system substrate-binding protein